LANRRQFDEALKVAARDPRGDPVIAGHARYRPIQAIQRFIWASGGR
jgi:hypothetical protein